MPRPIVALINSSALAHNLQQLRRSANGAKVWAVVKANAYGHGIANVYGALTNADGIALLDLKEAQQIRQLGWSGPILLLEGVFEASDLELCAQLNLWHSVHCHEQIEWLSAHKTQYKHHIFLKMNSGMNRLGFQPDAFGVQWSRLNALPQVSHIGLMTHFSDADGDRGVAHQIETFEKYTKNLPGERSICNSAAILRHVQHTNKLAFDWVRAGIAMYGSSPDYPKRTAKDWQLAPVMTLRSKILAIQRLQKGDSVGYGSAFFAESAMTIGIVACGYADGYPRHAATGTSILIKGQRTTTVGRVSMDMLALDLTKFPNTKIGDEVTLWGQASTGEMLSVDEVAHAAQTISYELLCALAPRVPVNIIQ